LSLYYLYYFNIIPNFIANILPNLLASLNIPNFLINNLISLNSLFGLIPLYGNPEFLAITIAFTVFVMFQIFNAINNRANSKEKNNFFLIAISASVILQLVVIYVPFFEEIFKTTAIGIVDWILILIVAATIFVSDKIANRFIK